MKWLWLGFALFWALSIVVDARRRDRVGRNVSAPPEPSTRALDSELPALLLPRSSP
jgi:hypothetical protein